MMHLTKVKAPTPIAALCIPKSTAERIKWDGEDDYAQKMKALAMAEAARVGPKKQRNPKPRLPKTLSRMEAIIALLCDGPKTGVELKEALGITRAETHAAIGNLIEDGRIVGKHIGCRSVTYRLKK